MSNSIPTEEAIDLIYKLKDEAIPINVRISTNDRIEGWFQGFVLHFADDLVIAPSKSENKWNFRVPVTNCLFYFGHKHGISKPSYAETFANIGTEKLVIEFSSGLKLSLHFNL